MPSVYGKIAGIDVHKKVLYVVIAAGDEEPCLQRALFGATTSDLADLSAWLSAEQVDTVVMESTAQYWKPVWLALESRFRLLLAQARSNAAPRGRKADYGDAARLVKRLRSGDLRLSFVPEAAQRDWRLLTRTRVEYGRDVVRYRHRLEGLLEECRIKISSLLSDLLGVSGRRILRALSQGETDPQKLADLRVGRVQASEEEFVRALNGNVRPPNRLLLGQYLAVVESLEQQTEQLDQELSRLLQQHQDAITRLCEVPGIATSAAEQIIAELGPTAATFPTPAQLASWVGACPGREQSAGVSKNDSCPKGNRFLRRVLNQCAWAAARTKGSYFEGIFQRLVPRLGVQKAICAIAHRLLRIIWRILHLGEHYQEHGRLAEHPASIERRFRRVAKQMAALGYSIQLTPSTNP
jgi:transposase